MSESVYHSLTMPSGLSNLYNEMTTYMHIVASYFVKNLSKYKDMYGATE